MDYAIYKTTNGKQPHPVHRFKQEDCNHRAKAAARKKLDEMWVRALRVYSNGKECHGTEEFSYRHYTSANGTYDVIRFYIDKLSDEKHSV